MHTITVCREMELYFPSFLKPTLHRRVFYLHAPATLPVETEPSGPSKYEATSAHIGEGFGLFVFHFWIAAYESSRFFRNVVASSHPRRRNRQQPCRGNIFS